MQEARGGVWQGLGVATLGGGVGGLGSGGGGEGGEGGVASRGC